MKKHKIFIICLLVLTFVSSYFYISTVSNQQHNHGEKLVVRQVDLESLKKYFDSKKSFVFILSKENCTFCENLIKMLNTTAYTLKEETLILHYTSKERKEILNSLKELFPEVISVPSIYIIKDGKIIDNMIGYTDEEQYWNFIYKHF